MSLVAYDSSDDSENEGEDCQASSIVVTQKPLQTNQTSNVSTDNGAENESNVIFGSIPQPESIKNINDEDDSLPLPKKVDYGDIIEKPPKKSKGPAKIFVPSLSDVSYLLVFTCSYSGFII